MNKKLLLPLLLSSLLLAAGTQIVSAQGNTFVAKATGNWSAAGTWTKTGAGASTFPIAGDSAVITGGFTVTLTATATAGAVNAVSGTLASATFNLSIAAASGFSGGFTANGGAFTATSGTLSCGYALINNSISTGAKGIACLGSMTIATGATLTSSAALTVSGGLFVNGTGVLTKSAGVLNLIGGGSSIFNGGNCTLGAGLTLSGTNTAVSFQSGTVTTTGATSIASTDTINVTGGTYSTSTSTTNTGGTLNVSSGSYTTASIVASTGSFQISGGSLTVNGTSSISGGINISGTGTVTTTGLMTLTGGTNTYSSSSITSSLNSLTVTSPASLAVSNGTLATTGAINSSTGNISITAGTLQVGTAATFAGGLSVTGTANYTSGGLTTINTVSPVFTSSGTITPNSLLLTSVTTNITTGTTINVTNATTVTGGSLTINGSGIFNTGSIAASTGAFVVNGASASLTTTTTAAFSGQLNVTLGTCTIGTTMTGTAAGSKIYVDGGTLNVNGASATFGNAATTDSLVVTAGTFNINNIANASIALSAGASVRISGGTINAGGKFGVGAATNAITYNQTGGDVYVATLGGSNSTTLASFDAGTAAGTVFSYTGGTLTVCQGQIGAAANLDFRGPNPAATVPPVMGSAVFAQFGTNVIVTPSIMATSNNTSFRISTSTPNAILNATNNPNLVNAAATTILGDLTLNGNGIYSGAQNLTVTGNSAASPGNIVINNTAHIAFTGGSTNFNGSFANQTFTNNGTVPDTLAAISMNKSVGGKDTLILNAPLVQRSSSLSLSAGIIRTTATNMLTLMPNVGVTTSSSSSFIDGPMTRYYTSTVASLASSIASLPIGKSGIGYLPLQLAPTVFPSGSSNIKIVAEVVDDATGSNISPSGSLSNKKWSIQTTEISGSLTNTLMQLKDATVGGITASSMILKSPTLGGTYKSIVPFSTAVANTSVTSASTLTRAEIQANSYYSYGLGCYSDTIIKAAPNVCLNYPVTLNTSGFNGTWSSASPSNISVTSPAGVATGLIYGSTSKLTFTITDVGTCQGMAIDTTLIVTNCAGGVPGSSLWVRGDDASPTSWTNFGYTNATITGSNSPTINDGATAKAINFNQVVTFNGTNQRYTTSSNFGIASANSFTTFGISTPTGSALNAYWCSSGGAPGTTFFFTRTSYPDIRVEYNSFNTIYNGSAPITLNQPQLAMGAKNVSVVSNNPSNYALQIAGKSLSVSNSGAGTNSSGTNLELAHSSSGGNEFFNGNMGEIIIFQPNLSNATDINKVNSYLALKYGITLDQSSPQNYTASDGTKMWDTLVASSGFNHNIFGIGRDDVSALYQKVSASVNPRNIVTLETENSFTKSNTDVSRTGSLSDLQFLTIADSATTSAPAFGALGALITGKRVLNNAWEVQNVNSVGAVYLQFNDSLAAYDLPLAVTNTLYLVYDNSGTISGSSTVVTLTQSGHLWRTATPITFSNNAKFTLAADLLIVPGGVSAPTLWIKADAGTSTTTEGAAVATWQNQSDNISTSNMVEVNAGQGPKYHANKLNYNPSLETDAVNFLEMNTAGNIAMRDFYLVSASNEGAVFPDWKGLLTASNTSNKRYAFLGVNGASTIYSNTADPALIQGNRFVDGLLTTNLAPLSQQHIMSLNDTDAVFAPTVSGILRMGVDNPGIGLGTRCKANYGEIIVYPRSVTGTEQNKVNSYLALKYGITLDANAVNYSSSAATDIYDIDATYKNNIIGISRDDASGLLQKQSHTMQSGWSSDSLRLFASTSGNAGTNADLQTTNALNTVAITSDQSFVVIGDDGLDQNSSAAVGMPAGIIARLNKTWKLTNTGFAQPFTIEIVLPASVPLANIGDLRLICNTAAGTGTPSALGTGSTVIAGGANGITFGSGSIIMSVDPTAAGSPFAAGNTAIFTIGSIANGTLPLNLLGFEAKVNGTQVATQWTVSNEQDVKGYEVQRSANSINGWITVATQNAAGNSTGSRTYSAADNNPLSGTSYYRLKINDHNGRIIYSDIRKIQFSTTAIVRITPNPTSGSITIKAPAGELRSVTIIDATGKPVKQIRGNAGDTQLSVDLSNLTKGVYIIKTQTTSQKVMVK